MKDSQTDFKLISTGKIKNAEAQDRLILHSITEPDGSKKLKLAVYLGIKKYFLKCEVEGNNDYKITSNFNSLPIKCIDQSLQVVIKQGLETFYKIIPSCIRQNIDEEVELIGSENKAFTD